MSGLLNIATSALNSFQRGLSVTGNNIANANSRGYSRQVTMFSANTSQKFGGSFSGTGVNVADVKRYSDDFATRQVRNNFSIKSQYDNFFNQALQIDSLLSAEGTSISTSLQQLFTAFGQLNDAPQSIAARGVVINQSQRLVDQFNSMQKKLDESQQNTSQQIQNAVTVINQLTTNIAAVNTELSHGNTSPELFDTRDQLLLQLSEYVEVSSTTSPDGTVNIGIAGGEMLVVGGVNRALSVAPPSTNRGGTSILLYNGAGNVDITTKFTTGMLGGLRDYETNILGRSSQLLGQMAIGMAQNFNAQHKLGVDLNGQLGKDFFTDYNSISKQQDRALRSGTNIGTGVLAVAISNIGQTQLSDYDVYISNAGAQELRIIRKSDGQATTLNWTSNPPAPPAGQVVLDGMTITVDDISHLADNDHFTLSPTHGAAADLTLNIKDATELAMASVARVQSNLSNQGSGRIILGDVVNTNGTEKDYRIDFISSTQYNLINVTDGTVAGPLTFTPNADNTIQIPDSINPAYSVIISGLPKAGDQFTAGFNIGGVGDNGNGLKLFGLQQMKLFSGNTESFSDRYSYLLADVGSRANQAKLGGMTADILFNQSLDFQTSISGVNLDEEASNLLRFEEAYNAAGKLMAIASQLMDVLFEAMR
jgi:flagellar hook-associated protein 1 FlgK